MFKKGEVVQLKSGGPLMGVSDVDGNTVHCRWFDKNNEEKSSSFPAEMLQAASTGPKAFYVPRQRRPIV
jgi:uncharacterized protein YodC (DUF2158 family)